LNSNVKPLLLPTFRPGIADLHNEKVFSVRFGDGEQVNLARAALVAELADGCFFLF